MIRFDHVSKRFATLAALNDITFEVSSGEFVFFIGPSGAGKTTILRLITRDLTPTKGKIFVDTWDVASLAPGNIHFLRRAVGMVFQDFKLLMDRTVYENIAIGLEILGRAQQETEKRVGEVMELVGLTEKRYLFPLQLSAGEMQRTGIARAIVAGPKIIMADEPTGNLDPQTAWSIMEVLGEINSLGTTVLMATHNAAIVNHLKKRTIALEHGKIVSDEPKGSYRLLKAKPKKDHGNP